MAHFSSDDPNIEAIAAKQRATLNTLNPPRPRAHRCSVCAGGRIPGVIVVDHDDRAPSRDGKVFVSRCDNCMLYASDEEAAEAVSRATGWPVMESYDRSDHLPSRERTTRGADWSRPYFAVTLKEATEVSR
jgi:hypothetical protein